MAAVSAPAHTILVVEDEANIRDVIRRYLERDGFAVREAADGYAALDEVSADRPDLVVLDLMLPGVDGLTLTRQFREKFHVPIVILTARGETSDRIRGLDLGADDYMTKPFSPQELVSRVRAVLRRTREAGSPAAPGQILAFGDVSLDAAGHAATLQGASVALTSTEFELLWFLARHPRQVFSRSQLLDRVWGRDFDGDPATVTVHIRRLREKIEHNPSQPRHLLTVWGVGYKLEP